MREHEADLRSSGANLAAIGLGDAPYARRFRQDAGIQFPLLIDTERVAYRAAGLGSGSLLHLLRAENARGFTRAFRAGHRQHRNGENPFQLGASFVFAPGDRDLYAHTNRTFGDNTPVEELIEAVRKA